LTRRRGGGVEDHALVEADHAGLQALDDAQRPPQVTRVDVGDEAELVLVTATTASSSSGAGGWRNPACSRDKRISTLPEVYHRKGNEDRAGQGEQSRVAVEA